MTRISIEYDSRVINYDRRLFIWLAIRFTLIKSKLWVPSPRANHTLSLGCCYLLETMPICRCGRCQIRRPKPRWCGRLKQKQQNFKLPNNYYLANNVKRFVANLFLIVSIPILFPFCVGRVWFLGFIVTMFLVIWLLLIKLKLLYLF